MSTEPAESLRVRSEPRLVMERISEHYALIPDDLFHTGKPSMVMLYGCLDRIARDNKTECNPSISFLSQFSGLSSRTVQTCLKWLEENGFIRIRRAGPGREQNVYYLIFRELRMVKNTNQNGTENGKNYQQSNRNQNSKPKDFNGSFANASEPLFLSAREEKSKTVADSEHHLILDWYKNQIGRLSNGAAEGAAVKKLLTAGFGLEDIKGCYHYLQSQSWRDPVKRISLATVNSEIDTWVKAGRPEKEQRNGNNKPQVKARPEVGTTFAELLGN